MKYIIITPSYINSSDRFLLAKKSLDSLQTTFASSYQHIIVDDTPKSAICIPAKIHSWFPVLKWNLKSKEVYNKSNMTLIRRFGSGSASALRDALEEAGAQSASLVFIHLDDHIYIPEMNTLALHAVDAFEQDESLSMLRFSGYPILYNNLIPLTYENDHILFDNIILRPERRNNYTLWWSSFNENNVDGRYWPIALWFCFYRLEFLKKLLEYKPVRKMQHLAHVELFYKDKSNWCRFLKEISGKFGYINMQFGGLEMHRNKNWQELIQLPNKGIV